MKNYLLQIIHQPDCSGKLILNFQEANKDLSVDRPVKGSAFLNGICLPCKVKLKRPVSSP